MDVDDDKNMPDYIRSRANKVADKRASEILTNKTRNEFCDVFPGIGYFEETLTLQVKEGSQPYQAPLDG